MVLAFFEHHFPIAETELEFTNTYELLVAVVLSAQCTDKRVNMVTPPLFERFPNPKSLAEASEEEVFQYIRSVSYPNNKTRHLIGLGKKLEEDFGGRVPMTREELMQLPGVGRKTANVITSVVDKQPHMAVDTHVFRVSARLGLTRNAKTPLQAEQQLVRNIPTALIHKAHHWLILYGRYVCKARNPMCNTCGLKNICKYYHAKERVANRKGMAESKN